MVNGYKLINGCATEVLAQMPGDCIDCVVTSPPYFGLRDYGVEGQHGNELTPEAYVASLLKTFREVFRVLKPEGTLWLNLGDSYYNYRPGNYSDNRAHAFGGERTDSKKRGMPDNPMSCKRGAVIEGVKEKDLLGIPWQVAFALRAAGWYLRQEIIWHKPNPMPESVKDRCTKAHETVFLFAKSVRYYFDGEAVKEPAVGNAPGNKNPNKHADQPHGRTKGNLANIAPAEKRNKRSVWTVPTKPFKGAHFAVFPLDLVRPCILAGCPPGGVVLDPYAGSCSTGVAALQEGRNFIGVDLNPEYLQIGQQRISEQFPFMNFENQAVFS